MSKHSSGVFGRDYMAVIYIYIYIMTYIYTYLQTYLHYNLISKTGMAHGMGTQPLIDGIRPFCCVQIAFLQRQNVKGDGE